MSEQKEEWNIRNILVALDASRHSLAALEAAADLAAGLKAELQGLFVEDVNLLRAASSPIAREVRYPFGAAARLDRSRMERQLRALASQARRALAEACERRHVKWSFRVVRGEVAPEVLTAAKQADLLTLGKAGRPLTRRERLGSIARAAAERSPHPVLLLQRDGRIQPPVAVIYDGSSSAREALRLAASLARHQGGYLAVLVVADSATDEYRLQAETAAWLRQRGLLIRYRRLPRAGVAALVEAVRTVGSGMLVLNRDILPPDRLRRLLDEVDCPVLLMGLTT